MKFCKNLQQVATITDPEWAPYWTNYKLLKKLIKKLRFLTTGTTTTTTTKTTSGSNRSSSYCHPRPPRVIPDHTTTGTATEQQQQQQQRPKRARARCSQQQQLLQREQQSQKQQEAYGHEQSAFFSLLRAELQKAITFFQSAEEQCELRVERVHTGIHVLKRPHASAAHVRTSRNDESKKWTLMARSVYRLYRDLLLLETFAIMTYLSFSKILKKHDKVTGQATRVAFMTDTVNKANFVHYPKILQMITLCEDYYKDVSQCMEAHSLYEDETLFLDMIRTWNRHNSHQQQYNTNCHHTTDSVPASAVARQPRIMASPLPPQPTNTTRQRPGMAVSPVSRARRTDMAQHGAGTVAAGVAARSNFHTETSIRHAATVAAIPTAARLPGAPRAVFAPRGEDLSWELLLQHRLLYGTTAPLSAALQPLQASLFPTAAREQQQQQQQQQLVLPPELQQQLLLEQIRMERRLAIEQYLLRRQQQQFVNNSIMTRLQPAATETTHASVASRRGRLEEEKNEDRIAPQHQDHGGAGGTSQPKRRRFSE